MSKLTANAEAIAQQFAVDGYAIAEGLADADGLAMLKPLYEGFLDGTIACATTNRKLGGLTTHIVMPHLYSAELRENSDVERARDIARVIQQTDAPELVFSAIF
jgi:hypothetical protein